MSGKTSKKAEYGPNFNDYLTRQTLATILSHYDYPHNHEEGVVQNGFQENDA